MIERLQRQLVFLAPAIVMSAWATVMLHTLLVGHINRLLNPMFRNYVGIAATPAGPVERSEAVVLESASGESTDAAIIGIRRTSQRPS